MAERVLRNDPNEVGRSLDEFGECALVGERGTMHEARDMVADLRGGDVLANLDYMAGEVAAKDASRRADEVDICRIIEIC